MENRWRAQRDGVAGDLVDHGAGRMAPFADLLKELIDMQRPEAEAPGCVKELLHIRRICAEGTSATRQRGVHGAAVAGGAGPEDAMKAVVDALAAEFTQS
jgi:carboxylate-amine ligase